MLATYSNTGRFKSCPRVGGIPRPLRAYARELQFQVVPPCGGHQRPNAVSSERLGFKSCPRVGGIHILASIPHGLRAVSSRAPVWGASSHIKNISEKGVVSSRAPVWGASGYE